MTNKGDTMSGAIFGPSAMVRTNLIVVHKVMRFTKYQGSRSCGFRQEDIFIFPIFAPGAEFEHTW